MAELTVKRIEAFHRILLRGDGTQLTAPGQRLTTGAAIELTFALYQAGKDASATRLYDQRETRRKIVRHFM